MPKEGPTSFALIVGAMKAGTSSMFHYLAAHPEIAPARDKEPDFFAADAVWARGPAWYRGLWDWDPDRHTIALEGSTSYSKHPHFPSAAERIAAFAGEHGARFRFIYLMRDPVERMVSQYMHLRSRSLTVQSLDEWVTGDHPVNVSRYAMQLDEYAERFPRADILPLLFEDLRDDPSATLERAFRFLDLEPAAVEKATTKVHNATTDRRIQPLWWLRARRLGVDGAARALTPRPVRRALRRLFTRSGANRMELTPAQRERLLARLAPDLRRLEDVYGVDVQRWESVRVGSVLD